MSTIEAQPRTPEAPPAGHQEARPPRPDPAGNRGRSALKLSLALVATAAAILFAIHILGQYSVGRMLARDATLTAELWSRIVAPGASDVGKATAWALHPDPDGARLGVETVAILSPDGVRVVGADDPDAGDELKLLLGVPAATPLTAASAATGVYSNDRVSWFGAQDYHSWAVLPARDPGGSRIALRVGQRETAARLAIAFVREMLFNGSVAAITFASFMAGFNYRQRKLAAENAAIRYQALHDELTGLPNRKHFENFMRGVLEDGEAAGHKSALFVLDLDGFKAVNDTLGHPVGDGLLRAAAMRLKASLRGGDLLVRLSGDEFAIVVPKLVDPAMLAPLAERVLKLVSNPFRVDGHEVQVGCSIGVAVAPDNGSDTSALMRNADFALYRAKSEGRRTWRFFDPKMAEDLAGRRTLADGLRHALRHDLFQVFYQPLIELSSGRTIGYEAMLRWRLPWRGLVPASVFVPVAEESGLIVAIGEWALRQVAKDCALIPAERHVAINLSVTQLKLAGIESVIFRALAEHDVPTARIRLEVNEAILGRDERMVFERLAALRGAGVRIVMDSFASASISLGLLSRGGFDVIKLDRAFLLQDERNAGAVLAAVCHLGRSLGFRVAGQRVETAEEAHMLRAFGCSEGQGHHFGAPMPLEEVLARERLEVPLVAAG